MTEPLAMWIVYDHPSDHPDCYIARVHEIYSDGAVPTGETFEARDLETIRAFLRDQLGLVCIARDAHDDPVVVESWL